MQKIGKKVGEWIESKQQLIEIYKQRGIVVCENCGSSYLIAFHHRPKRSSQEAVHDLEHTRLLCQECHKFFEYNDDYDKKLFEKERGYNQKLKMGVKKEKSKSNKSEWQREHTCRKCKRKVYILICPYCGEISI